jgi:hypothetical protein
MSSGDAPTSPLPSAVPVSQVAPRPLCVNHQRNSPTLAAATSGAAVTPAMASAQAS